MLDYDTVMDVVTNFDGTKKCTSTWGSGEKRQDEIMIGFAFDDDDHTAVKLTSEQALDVCHHIFYVMGWKRFFMQFLHNKFKR